MKTRNPACQHLAAPSFLTSDPAPASGGWRKPCSSTSSLSGLVRLLLALGALILPGWVLGAQSPAITIYVVSHGWHTGIVVPRREISMEFWPPETEFAEDQFLEFGWGDAGFYQAADTVFWKTLKAAIVPSAAVLHVAGFRGPVTGFFPASGVVAIDLSPEAFYGLAQYLDQTIVKLGDRPVTPLGTGLYGRSYFYAAHGNYTFFNNCNHWVARGLSAAGLRIDTGDAMTATSVFDQARRVGRTLRNES